VKNSYYLCLWAMCAVGGTLASGEAPGAPAGNVVCIHLYNIASAPPKTAAQAMWRVTRILATAGIVMTWEQQPADSPEAHVIDLTDTTSSSVRSATRPCLVVAIVPDVSAGAYHGALGFAVPFARSGIDVEAVYRRIVSEAKTAGIEAQVVLAYVIAHEIGHVLLQSSQHAAVGIMRAHYNAEDWRLAAFGILAFLPGEAKQMRRGLWRFKGHEERSTDRPGTCGLLSAGNPCAGSKHNAVF